MKRIFLSAFYALFILSALFPVGEKGAIIPNDPDVVKGYLSNGMSYYIRENQKPVEKAHIRLVVKAGSLMESHDQLGLAHFLEHMAFNGTRQFKEEELVDYLESIGMRFGPDLNAYTSFEETVYFLTLPTNDKAVLEKGVTILEEWAFHMALNDEAIEKERGVIIEEWRRTRGAFARILDRIYPKIFYKSRYAERLPIGDMDIIRNFDPDTLRQFYKTWYKPENMAIVAVGDFDASEIEALIVKKFSPYQSEDRKRFDDYEMPSFSQPLYAIESDKEMTQAFISLYVKDKKYEVRTIYDYKEYLAFQLFSKMVNMRLLELQESPGGALLRLSSNPLLFKESTLFSIGGSIDETRISEGAEALFNEIEKIRQIGFTEAEFELAKGALRKEIREVADEWSKLDSDWFAYHYQRNFLKGIAIPPISWEVKMTDIALEEITLEQVIEEGRWIVEEANRTVAVMLPEQSHVEAITEEQLAEIYRKATEVHFEPYEESSPLTLFDRDIPAGLPVFSDEVDSMGIHHVELGNGMNVVIKKTSFMENQISVLLSSPGGRSLVEDKDIVSSKIMLNALAKSGLGEMGSVDLAKFLSTKRVSLSPFVGTDSHGFRGRTSGEDMETLFQMLNLYFSNPNIREEAWQDSVTQQIAAIRNRESDPGQVFFDLVTTTLYNNHPRATPITEERVEREAYRGAAEALYQKLFASPTDFTLYLVGSVDRDEAVELANRYLGSFKRESSGFSVVDRKLLYLEGREEVVVERGIEPIGEALMLYTGPIEWSYEEAFYLSALTDSVEMLLTKEIRERAGGTYSIQLSSFIRKEPYNDYQIVLFFGCDPERAEELIQLIREEIERIKGGYIDSRYTEDVVAQKKSLYKTEIERNSYWVRMLSYFDKNDLPYSLLEEREALIETYTTDKLIEIANRYLNEDQFLLGIRYPANFKER